MSKRVVRRMVEFVAAVAMLGYGISLFTPLRKGWEWLLAASSFIVLYICVRTISRLASRENSAASLNRPNRKL